MLIGTDSLIWYVKGFMANSLDRSRPVTWTASWIRANLPEQSEIPSLDPWLPLLRIDRVWHPDNPSAACFRKSFALETIPSSARLIVCGPPHIAVAINGIEVSDFVHQGTALIADVSPLIRRGTNTIAIAADAKHVPSPGLIARLDVHSEHGEELAVVTSDDWRTEARTPIDCHHQVIDDSHWTFAKAVGQHGDPPHGREPITYRQSPYFRRDFILDESVKQARIYATACGVYDLFINGTRVSDDRLAPGWTDYRVRINYQHYDTAELLRHGKNTIGLVASDGWYAGMIARYGRHFYGKVPQVLAQLDIELASGRRLTIDTDDQWTYSTGSIMFSDLQLGEVHDHRAEQPNWSTPEFNNTSWHRAITADGPGGVLDAQVAPPVRVQQWLQAQRITRRGADRWIIDFGQNMTGWVQFIVNGREGQRVFLRHGEELGEDGELYTDNLRGARQTDEYTLSGAKDEVCEPHFTIHGFRYVEISGHPQPVRHESVRAAVVHAAMRQIGEFSSSNPSVNRLQQNILWSLRGNFLTVPTDCPQRDERLGWTADAQIFATTAAFNFDVLPFFKKWLLDLRDAQRQSGSIPHVAPDAKALFRPHDESFGAGTSGWGDAIVLVPWDLYWSSGDTSFLEDNYQAMSDWIDYCALHSEGGVRPGDAYGDWLAPDDSTPRELASTAYFLNSVRLMARISTILSRPAQALRYGNMWQDLRSAFRNRFLPGGRPTSASQGSLVFILAFDIADDAERAALTARLVDDIRSRDWRLSTGFLSTPHILRVLEDNGQVTVADRLLHQTEYPSWLYPIVHHDATTIWEQWNGIKTDGSFLDPETNSFNHYAYGAVGQWIYESVGGLRPLSPGYRHIAVRPRPTNEIQWATVSHHGPQGKISVDWKYSKENLNVSIEIPTDSHASVTLPPARTILVNGDEVSSPGFELGPGQHEVTTH